VRLEVGQKAWAAALSLLRLRTRPEDLFVRSNGLREGEINVLSRRLTARYAIRDIYELVRGGPKAVKRLLSV
jgi:hypothetical protein